MSIRIFSPTLTHRLADPMPLPRRRMSTQRASAMLSQATVMAHTVSLKMRKFTYRLQKIPMAQ